MASNYFIGSVPKPIQNLCNSEAWFGLNCLTVSPNDNPKCELDPQRSVSECKVFYKSPSPPPPSQGNTFGLTFERSPNLTRLERTFRHAGGAFESRLSGEVSWAITTNIDWSTELTSWPVRDQKSCGIFLFLPLFFNFLVFVFLLYCFLRLIVKGIKFLRDQQRELKFSFLFIWFCLFTLTCTLKEFTKKQVQSLKN